MSKRPMYPQNIRFPSVQFHVYVGTLENKRAITRHLKVLAALRGTSISDMLKALLMDFLRANPINESIGQ